MPDKEEEFQRAMDKAEERMRRRVQAREEEKLRKAAAQREEAGEILEGAIQGEQEWTAGEYEDVKALAEEAQSLFSRIEWIYGMLGQPRQAQAIARRRRSYSDLTSTVEFLRQELVRAEGILEEEKDQKQRDIRSQGLRRERTEADIKVAEALAKDIEERARRAKGDRTTAGVKAVTKLVQEVGMRGSIIAGRGIVPSRKRDLSLYEVGKPSLDLFKIGPRPLRRGERDLFPVPKAGPSGGLMAKGLGLYGGEGLGSLRMGPGTGDSRLVASPMSQDVALPRGWTREMGAAYTEIKENGDVDTVTHVKDKLQSMGVPRARTAQAISDLVKTKAVRPEFKAGETDQVLVITGTMSPREKSPGKYGFKGTGKYQPRVRRKV